MTPQGPDLAFRAAAWVRKSDEPFRGLLGRRRTLQGKGVSRYEASLLAGLSRLYSKKEGP